MTHNPPADLHAEKRLQIATHLLTQFASPPAAHHFEPTPGKSYLMKWDGSKAKAKSARAGFVFTFSTPVPVARALMEAVDAGLRVYLDYGDKETGQASNFVEARFQPIREGYVAGYHENEGNGWFIPCLIPQIRSKDGERLPTENILAVTLLGRDKAIYRHPTYKPFLNWEAGSVNEKSPGAWEVVAPDWKGIPVPAITLGAEDQALRWLQRRQRFEAPCG